MTGGTSPEGKPWGSWSDGDREKVRYLARAFELSSPGEPIALESEVDGEVNLVPSIDMLWFRKLIRQAYEGRFDPTISVSLVPGSMDGSEIAGAREALIFSRERGLVWHEFKALILAHVS